MKMLSQEPAFYSVLTDPDMTEASVKTKWSKSRLLVDPCVDIHLFEVVYLLFNINFCCTHPVLLYTPSPLKRKFLFWLFVMLRKRHAGVDLQALVVVLLPSSTDAMAMLSHTPFTMGLFGFPCVWPMA